MILKMWVKVRENGWVKVREKLPAQVVGRSWKITSLLLSTLCIWVPYQQLAQKSLGGDTV